MNTVLDTFTLEFQEKAALERRRDALERSIGWYEDRIERYSRGCRIRPWRQRQIDRIQEKLDVAQEELSFVNDELTSFENVEELPRDTYGFSVTHQTLSNGKAFTRVVLDVEDSLYDDTFEVGDTLLVSASGSRRTIRGTQSSVSTVRLIPVENEDGTISSFYGSTRLGSIATEYDNFALTIRNEANELLYTEELGAQVIA